MDLGAAIELAITSDEALVPTLKQIVGGDGASSAQKVVALTEQITGANSVDMIAAYSDLSEAYSEQGESEEASSAILKALKAGEYHHGPKSIEVADLIEAYAFCLVAENQLKQARLQMERALSIEEFVHGIRSEGYIFRLNTFALILQAQGRLEEAENTYRRLLEIDAETLGEQHPVHGRHLNSLGRLVAAQGRLDESEAIYLQALEAVQRLETQADRLYVEILSGLAFVWGQREQTVKARQLLEEAVGILRTNFPADKSGLEAVQNQLDNLISEPN